MKPNSLPSQQIEESLERFDEKFDKMEIISQKYEQGTLKVNAKVLLPNIVEIKAFLKQELERVAESARKEVVQEVLNEIQQAEHKDDIKNWVADALFHSKELSTDEKELSGRLSSEKEKHKQIKVSKDLVIDCLESKGEKGGKNEI